MRERTVFDLVGQAVIGGQGGVKVFGGSGRVPHHEGGRGLGQAAETHADHVEAVGVVFRHVVRDAAGRVVEMRAAERFRIDDLAGCAFDEVRAAQAHEARLFDHDEDVAERRKIGAARDARAHHGGKLRHPELAPHKRIIEEDAARAVLAGEDAVLIRKIDAGGIDQIDDRHAVAHGDFLRAQNLGDGFGPPGAGFHRGVVGDDDGGAAFDFADAGDDAGGGGLAVVLVVGDEQADFEEARAGIEQVGDAFARRQFAGFVLLLDFRWAAALAESFFELVELLDEMAHVGGAGEWRGREPAGMETIVPWAVPAAQNVGSAGIPRGWRDTCGFSHVPASQPQVPANGECPCATSVDRCSAPSINPELAR